MTCDGGGGAIVTRMNDQPQTDRPTSPSGRSGRQSADAWLAFTSVVKSCATTSCSLSRLANRRTAGQNVFANSMRRSLTSTNSEKHWRRRPPVLQPQPLPPVPVEVRVDLQASPVTVELEISGVVLRWIEEVDWAERGHQIAPAQLRRVEDELEKELAAVGYRDPSPELLATLAASADLVAADALETVRRRQVWTDIRLDDLARPCPACGGWRDLRDRCPTCAARAWQVQQLILERNRLRRERDEVFRDWQRARDRLPIIQRQLAEVEADIRQLEEKGVRLSSDG
jgi:hypothetical protein